MSSGSTKVIALALALLGGLRVPGAAAGGRDLKAEEVGRLFKLARPDPSYPDTVYSVEAQKDIYDGGKRANRTARPLELKWGRKLYLPGAYSPAPTWLGRKNPIAWHAMAYGDLRTAVAYNDNGAKDQNTAAARLNLDMDLKLTATERFHAFTRPLDRGAEFSRVDFGRGKDQTRVLLDFELDTLFFEGDLARMAAGAIGRDNGFDLPVAGGLMPMVLQNGIWVEDAFTGAALTVPARNSRLLDISNFDVTLFAGFDRVRSAGIVDRAGRTDDRNASVYGLAAFLEANEGYWEFGYGYTDATANLSDLDYHNLTAALTRRYGGLVSNSARVVCNFGQARARDRRTADGVIVLLENSFITRRPLTVVPYLNLFAGFDRPQSLARDAGAGGILKNTGLVFETDGLTGFPKLDDTGSDVVGGAAGLEYLFDPKRLNRQIVIEVAHLGVLTRGNRNARPAKGPQLGVGLRFQTPLSNAWILRADAMAGSRTNEDEIAGARLEIRRKF